jgi:hypothetical protein
MQMKWNRTPKRGFARFVALSGITLVPFAAAVAQLQPVNLQGNDQVDAVAIVLTRFGPYPNSFTHTATPFLLSIVNRSGVLEDTFSIIRNPSGTPNPPALAAALSSLLDLHSTHSRQRDHQIIKPLPGTYQIVFKAHPDWVINVTITAN